MINLSNMSDAELGALVRKNVGDILMQKALASAEQREAAERAVLAERQRLAKAENRRRRSLITLPQFKLAKVTYAPLNVKEAQWDEVMPKGLATKYLRLIESTFGFQFDKEDEEAYEVVTWRVAYGIHSSWTSPDGTAKRQFTAIKKALKCNDAAALAAWWPVPDSGKSAYEKFMASVGHTL